jgi:hypothetical protein
LRQFSVCKHAIACTPAGSLAFVAHGSAYSNRSPDRHDCGLPQVSAGSAPAYDFSRPPRRSQLSYGLLTRHAAKRRVFSKASTVLFSVRLHLEEIDRPIGCGWHEPCVQAIGLLGPTDTDMTAVISGLNPAPRAVSCAPRALQRCAQKRGEKARADRHFVDPDEISGKNPLFNLCILIRPADTRKDA